MAKKISLRSNIISLKTRRSAPYEDLTDFREEDDDGSEGGSGSHAGTGEPLMDMSVFGLTPSEEMLLAQAIRKGEAQFGRVPFTQERKENQNSNGLGQEGPKAHPIIEKFDNSQRFAGRDRKYALPKDNPEAQRKFAHELQLRHTAQPTAKPTMAPTLTPR